MGTCEGPFCRTAVAWLTGRASTADVATAVSAAIPRAGGEAEAGAD